MTEQGQPQGKSMPEKRYRIVFEGRMSVAKEGPGLEEAKANLQKALKIQADQMKLLFSGRAVVLKKNLSLKGAQNLSRQLSQLGAQCRIVPMAKTPPEPPSPPKLPKSGPEKSVEDQTHPLQPSYPDIGPTAPSRWWYGFAAILCLGGILGAVGWLILTVIPMWNSGTQFMVPGQLEFQVDKPGPYTIWNETRSIFNGRLYAPGGTLPKELSIRVKGPGQQTISVTDATAATETVGEIKRKSIAAFQSTKAGRHQVTVLGNFPDRIFTVRADLMTKQLLGRFIAVIMTATISFFGSLGIFLYIFVKRRQILRPVDPQITPSGKQITQEAQNWALACHMSALSGLLIPFGTILGPLILWLIKRDLYPLVDDQGKEALNFQISVLIYAMVATLLIFVLVGILLLFALFIFSLAMSIVAGIQAGQGKPYRYPLTIRMIR